MHDDIIPTDRVKRRRESMRQLQLAEQEYYITKVDTPILVKELWERGVSVKDVFGYYYQWEAAEDGRKMTVEDAELAIPTERTKESF